MRIIADTQSATKHISRIIAHGKRVKDANLAKETPRSKKILELFIHKVKALLKKNRCLSAMSKFLSLIISYSYTDIIYVLTYYVPYHFIMTATILLKPKDIDGTIIINRDDDTVETEDHSDNDEGEEDQEEDQDEDDNSEAGYLTDDQSVV